MMLCAGLKTMEKPFKKRLTAMVGVSAEVGRKIGKHRTGRWISDDDDRKLAQEWSGLGSKLELLSHAAADRFRAELASKLRAAGNNLPCVRGRTREQKGREINGWRDMGPEDPPVHENWYNEIGVVALYLCDCERGVHREVKQRSDPRVYLQEYDIPLDKLRLADFSSAHLDNFTRAVFEAAEDCCIESYAGPSDYRFSQVVGQLVREANYDGMLVPSVRGDQDFRFRNVVIFDEDRQWHAWSRKEAGFQCVSVTDASVQRGMHATLSSESALRD